MEKKLTRSRRHKVFGGVCGGLAQYFNIDPIIIRIIFVVLTIAQGMGILAYIIMWIVIPEEPFEQAYPLDPSITGTDNANSGQSDFMASMPPKKENGKLILGIILIGIGIVFMADRFLPYFDFSDVFPFALVVIGASLLFNSFNK